jgi:hypothetical protein
VLKSACVRTNDISSSVKIGWEDRREALYHRNGQRADRTRRRPHNRSPPVIITAHTQDLSTALRSSIQNCDRSTHRIAWKRSEIDHTFGCAPTKRMRRPGGRLGPTNDSVGAVDVRRIARRPAQCPEVDTRQGGGRYRPFRGVFLGRTGYAHGSIGHVAGGNQESD